MCGLERASRPEARNRRPGKGRRLECQLGGGQFPPSTTSRNLEASPAGWTATIPPLIAKHIGAAHLAVLMAGGDA